jgi:predicted transcriptional regulator
MGLNSLQIQMYGVLQEEYLTINQIQTKLCRQVSVRLVERYLKIMYKMGFVRRQRKPRTNKFEYNAVEIETLVEGFRDQYLNSWKIKHDAISRLMTTSTKSPAETFLEQPVGIILARLDNDRVERFVQQIPEDILTDYGMDHESLLDALIRHYKPTTRPRAQASRT